MNNFGTITYDGKEYTLTSQAEFEYRSHKNGFMTQYPNNYLSAMATLEDKEYKVWWFIEDTTVELDSIDYDNVTDVELI